MHLTASVALSDFSVGPWVSSGAISSVRAVSNPITAAMSGPNPWELVLSSRAQRLASLGRGWDGPGSIPINKSVLRRAAALAADALSGVRDASAPCLVPGGDGSLQIEWHEIHGELELDIAADGKLSLWGKNHLTSGEFEGEDDEALALFYRWAPWIASQAVDVDHEPDKAADPVLDIAA